MDLNRRKIQERTILRLYRRNAVFIAKDLLIKASEKVKNEKQANKFGDNLHCCLSFFRLRQAGVTARQQPGANRGPRRNSAHGGRAVSYGFYGGHDFLWQRQRKRVLRGV